MGKKLAGILKELYNALFDVYGERECTLDHKNPFQLLIATILSAQCTDERVNKTTPALFDAFPGPKAFAQASQEQLEAYIRPTGFFRAKSANIIKACNDIVDHFDGKVPDKMKDLTSLAGVGRKTANVILGDAFEIPGFPVDTHVKRLLNRIGVVKCDDPVKIENIINSDLPDKYWTNFSHLLIIHGRTRCKARKPECSACEIFHLCRFGKKNFKNEINKA